MKRSCPFCIFLALLFLALPHLCFAGTVTCSPPKFVSYVIVNPNDVSFKFSGACNIDSNSNAYGGVYKIEAHWQKPIAQEYIEVEFAFSNSVKNIRSQIITSHCQYNPWLTDNGLCQADPFEQGEVAADFSLGPNSKLPISWNAIPADKKNQIAISVAMMESKNNPKNNPVPKQPTRIMVPPDNQAFFGPPAKVQYRILHDADWPVKLEFLFKSKIGNTYVWLPRKVTLQNVKTVYATGNDTVTPVQITSGEAILDMEGKWQMLVSYVNPVPNLQSSASFTVQPANPNLMPKKTVPLGGIKLK